MGSTPKVTALCCKLCGTTFKFAKELKAHKKTPGHQAQVAEQEAIAQEVEWRGLKLFRKMNKKDIERLPAANFPGDFKLVTTVADVEAAVAHLRCFPIIGFDTETRPARKKGQKFPVSLIQLACLDMAFLVQLVHFGHQVPAPIKELLEDAAVQKVGVGVGQDMNQLRPQVPGGRFSPDGVLDLATLGRQCGLRECGLRGLTALLLQANLRKTQQMSRWDHIHLSSDQLTYAAYDAFAGLRIHEALHALDVPALRAYWDSKKGNDI